MILAPDVLEANQGL